ncbi:MAG: hypothetical protein GXY07_20915 [Candidatus Hydrogenedentes bacterium]|nr:hypothetical protein [Candidatus Hydrogenedentota bacterium]
MKPGSPGKSGSSRFSNGMIRVKWSTSLMYAGPYPAPAKRFFKFETLQNAVEKCLQEKDRFFWSGLNTLSNNLPITSLQCDLIYEDALRLVYSLTLATQSRKLVYARLVIAKNHEECSALLEKECTALTILAERCPGGVAPVAARGVIFLPDRHMRREVSREVFAYFIKVPPGLTPLYVASATQFAPHGPKPARYSVKDTEVLKKSIVRVLAKCYEEKSGSGIVPADLCPECFAVQHPLPANNASSVLLQCPRVRKRLAPGYFMHALMFGILGTGKHRMALAPVNPEAFFDALTGAVGAEKAREWCRSLAHRRPGRDDLSPGEAAVELPGKDYLDALSAVAGL